MLHALRHQQILDPVGNVSLGDGTEIGDHPFPGQIGPALLHQQIVAVNQGKGCVQFLLGGIMALSIVDVPQVYQRTDGHIKMTLRKGIVLF